MNYLISRLKNSAVAAVVISIALGTTPGLAKQPVPVIIIEAKLDLFEDKVEALGTLRATESVDITATVTDTVTTTHFEGGERVVKDDILVEMTNAEEHAVLEEEMSTFAEAKQQLSRIENLVRKGVATKTLLDERRRDYETSRARLRQIESRLKDRLILAPFSGVVGLRNISVGALVEPGDLITTLDDDRIMKLDFSVPAIYLDTLKTGLKIEATASAFGKRIFSGKLSSLNSRIDETTRSIVARAVLPNDKGLLKPGMLMSVILLKNPRSVVVIPEEALLPEGSKNFVLLVDQSANPVIAEKREVEIGKRRPGEVEIRSGLSAGDFVVTHGELKVRPGEAVRVITVDKGNESLEQMLSRQTKDNTQ